MEEFDMRRAIAPGLFLAWAALTGMPSIVAAAPQVVRWGDADLDGMVTVSDAGLIEGRLLNTPCRLSNEGVSSDGKLSIADVMLAAQYASSARPAISIAGNGAAPFTLSINSGDAQVVGVGAPAPLLLATQAAHSPLSGACVDATRLKQSVGIISDSTGGALLGYNAATGLSFDQVGFLGSSIGEGISVTMGPQPGIVEVQATVSYALADGSGQVDDSVIFTLTTPSNCGNGTVEPGEACDDGPGEGPGLCLDDCSALETCGDGLLVGGEVCDDGNLLEADGCSPTCDYENPLCGNGTLDSLAPAFSTELALPVGGGAINARVADLDGDGFPDIVAANSASGSLSVYLGNGNGTFSTQGIIPASGDPTGLAVADLNGDPHPDLVVTHPLSNKVVSYLGVGDGSFILPPTVTAFLVNDPLMGVSGDFDAVGGDDFVFLDGNGQQAVSMRNLDCCGGLLEVNNSYPVGLAPADMLAFAFDAGIANDLLVVNRDEHSIQLFPNLGGYNGFDLPLALFLDTGVSRNPVSAAVGEVDGDNDHYWDIITADNAAPPYSGFSRFSLRRKGVIDGPYHINSSAQPRSILLSDLNDDGHLDMLASHTSGGNQVSLYLGDGAGNFSAPIAIPAGNDPAKAVTGDFNLDGLDDLVLVNAGATTVSVLMNRVRGEQCDDSNRVAGDGCDSYCQLESPGALCGDGVVNAIDEGCDDGENGIESDDCLPECVAAFCGDGTLQTSGGATEACDNGFANDNTVPNACRENCVLPSCGDGVVDDLDGEACDSGAANSDVIPNACHLNCQLPYCSDGKRDDTEECDDGNLATGDGCDGLCRIEYSTGLPDTGQAACYNNSAIIGCPSDGAAFSRQDASVDRPGPSFSTIYTGTVRDDITGLMWEQTPSATPVTQPNAVAYCEALTLDGFNDWRLPELHELALMADFGGTACPYSNGLLAGPGCVRYWSTTPHSTAAPDQYFYWFDFNTGTTTLDYFSSSYYARCVRGDGSALGDLHATGLTVTDDSNQLMWQAGTNGASIVWSQALDYCRNLTLGGYNDWRLPDIKEAMTLVDFGKPNPSLDALLFPGSSFEFWTATTTKTNPFYAFRIQFNYYGYIQANFKTTANSRARCVRDAAGVINNNAVLDPGEQCDDGMHCDDGTPCFVKADCTAAGSFNCQPRDGDGCDSNGQCTGGDCSALCGNGLLDTALEVCDDGNQVPKDGCTPQCLFEFRPSLLADTGQTQCFAISGSPTDCYPPSSSGGGEDGYYQRTPPNFTVSNGVAHDNLTGLDWEETPAYPTAASLASATANCASLVKGGYDDWRIPSIDELVTLADWGHYYCPLTHKGTMQGTACDWYWSSTVYPTDANYAFSFNFNDGALGWQYIYYDYRMRCVRGAPLTYGDYRPGGATVTDRSTGIMWQAGVSPTTLTWFNALGYCNDLVLEGYDNWRLPDIRELQTLISEGYYNPTAESAHFGTGAPTLWSSSSFERNFGSNAYAIRLNDGALTSYGKTSAYSARCIRDDLWSHVGNGIVDASEACDDGNGTSGDGCDTDGTCTGGDCSLLCGDGVINAITEECDDANSIAVDGCDSCQVVPIPTPLTDTNQRQCYNDGNLISCPPPSASFGGQDGYYLKTPPDFEVTGNVVVDNNTGLAWERTPSDPSGLTWSEARATCSSLVKDGYDDWRLPNIIELESILDWGRQYCPFVDTSVFPGQSCDHYWSETESPGDPVNYAWGVNFSDIDFNALYKFYDYRVRCVRGPELKYNQYRNNGDTVTDLDTGLMWQSAVAATGQTWSSALSLCNGLVLAGFDDWRLPDIRELHSLRARFNFSPIVPLSEFGTSTGNFWSSTSWAGGYGSQAYRVNFNDADLYRVAKSTGSNVRCVRDNLLTFPGNGIVELGEECDDGNGVNGDGCDNGSNCTGGNCSALCGNGLFDAVGEACEDANNDPRDGCDSCQIVPIPTLLPDTGQERCYLSGSTLASECRADSVSQGGQDGFYSRTPPNWVHDGTVVTDMNTGLMWEKVPSFGSTYTWSTAYAQCDGLSKGGYDDWRLPSIVELAMMADFGTYGCPYLDSSVFDGTNCGYYWSRDRHPGDPVNYSWLFSFSDGQTTTGYNYNAYSMRCVRGAAPAYRDFIVGVNTHTDVSTGIMWQAVPDTSGKTWTNALSHCNNLVLDGYDDWRLPDIKETHSLRLPEAYQPAVDPALFGAATMRFWTSTNYEASYGASAYYFSAGDASISYTAKSSAYGVRCIRYDWDHFLSNGVLDSGEECDDGRHCTGGSEDGQSCTADDRPCLNGGGVCEARAGDGCEPDGTCTGGDCSSLCGDGMISAADEECDDGNLNPYDGCSPGCLRIVIPTVLADTGQEYCWGTGGSTGSIPCLDPDQTLGGQDGFYHRTPMNLVPDGTVVSDLNTGLIWEQSPDFAPTSTWWAADANCAMLAKGGYDDWRLPTLFELSSIANWGVLSCPMTVPSVFTGLPCEWHWSSDRHPSDLAGSHHVFGFHEGVTGYSADGNSYRTRCVRGTLLPPPDFRIQGQTVTDRSTGLTWQAGVSPTAFTWSSALDYCNDLVLEGYEDWRLPDIRELYSIVDPGAFNPSSDAASLGGSAASLWSSTTYNPSGLYDAHYVRFTDGLLSRISKTNATLRARCVRDDLWNTAGNGRQEGSEACDDGNAINGDGCESDGTCTGGSCASLCGNGLPDAVMEECDDGNLLDNDGCSSNCQQLHQATLLPDTGQSWCFNTDTAAPCLPPASALGGQDGFYQRTPPSFTVSGNMVVDNNTGLVWQRDDSPATNPYASAQSYCDALVLDGFTNWRLPTEHELLGIVDWGQPGIAIHAAFTGTNANWYWSQTPAGGNILLWHRGVNYDRGTSTYLDNGTYYQARCVRGPLLPQPEFRGTGAVVREATWLNQWQSVGDGLTRNWSAALSYCNDLVLGGYDDWRLPDVRELSFLVNGGTSSPALSPEHFSGAMNGVYWTSTSSIEAGSGDNAFTVSLSDAAVSESLKTALLYSRCVRSDFNGQRGNGVVDADEACDDANLVAGDGCEPDGSCTGGDCGPLCGNGALDAAVEECDDSTPDNFDGCTACLETAIPSVLPDTNQLMCFDADSPISCDSPQSSTGGQDGYYVQTPPSFSVGSTVVVDNRTGLVWERTPSNASTYLWSAADVGCQALVKGGYDDWRLPSAQELMTITDYASDGPPAIDTAVFSGTSNDYYWSGTPRAGLPSDKYAVHFSNGNLVIRADSSSHRVRCVRGSPWTGTPALTVSGVVSLDLQRRLAWQRAEDPTLRTWTAALAYCNNLVLDGRDDWRVPSIREAMSLLDLGSQPSLDPLVFSSVSTSGYWTSTTAPGSVGDQAFYFDYALYGESPPAAKSGTRRTKCVASLSIQCGNGQVEAGEQCDDGNRISSDGCDTACSCETPGCTGLCGNGVLDAAVEACDDGNTVSGDGCRSDCLGTEACGDGLLDAAAGEICDDGHALPCGPCNADCTGPGTGGTCGDGVLCAETEMCDDNNTLSGDGCHCDCQNEQALSQWAYGAPTFSSQYSTGGWSAAQATGAPNVASCGDSPSAWTTACNNCGVHWIELVYSTPVHATQVRVRETYNPGGLIQVDAYPFPSGPATTLWSGSDPNAACPGTAVIASTPACGFLTNRIRLTVNTSLTPSWDEIDAVELIGVIPNRCGNALLEGLEFCDDGNTTDGDGCNASCSGP